MINTFLRAWCTQLGEEKVKYDEFVHQCVEGVAVHATRLTKISQKAAIEESWQRRVRVAYNVYIGYVVVSVPSLASELQIRSSGVILSLTPKGELPICL